MGGTCLQGGLLRVVSYQGGLSSGWSFIRVVSSGWSFIRVVFYQGGLLTVSFSGWSFIRVVSSGLPFIGVVFHLYVFVCFFVVVFYQGSLSSVWSFIRVVF